MTADPYGTQGLREAALAGWLRQPARFREDANAEEDHARGYYRDRVVVELAQNAADAAARAGVPGRLLLWLRTGPEGATLVAANTGEPLDAAGVASLASLRASAKRDTDAVGRFGVGFAAVRSVADEVTVASRTGAVHFWLQGTRQALTAADAAGDLAAEVARRSHWLPVLRLPFPGPSPAHESLLPPLETWDTAVVLTLRDVASVRAQLAAVDDTLLLALPALAEVTVHDDAAPVRVVHDVALRWVVVTRGGVVDPALLADRGVEEQARTGWQVTWAVPRTPAGTPAVGRVNAPTPTDEPCTLPALLIATFPLDPTRRHVAPGPLTDALVAHAGRAWAELLAACRRGLDAGGPAPDPLDLVPTGLPAGPLDAALREATLAATRATPLLVPAGGGGLVAPADALVLDTVGDPAALTLLGRWWPTLVDIAPWHRHVVRLLDMTTTELSDLVEAVPGTGARDLYDAFAAADARTLEQLATVPVPLADGRTVRGARGCVLLEEDLGPAVLDDLGQWGLRVVHPDAHHVLLERLGAERLDAAGLLRHPVIRERVLAGADPEETDAVVRVVLSLVGAALRSGTVHAEPWWGEVLLPAQDGELLPARGLVLPGSPAARVLDPEVLPPVDPGVEQQWGREVLEAVGVRTDLVFVRLGEPHERAALTESLDGWEAYSEAVDLDEDDDAADMLVVADLDAVRPDAWPEVLATLAAGRGRQALAPVRVVSPAGAVRTLPSYPAWWLRRRAGLGLDGPFALAGGVTDWLPPAPATLTGLDAQVQRFLGGVATPEELDADGWADLLARLRASDDVDLAVAVQAWRALVRHALARDLGRLADTEVLPALVALGRCRAVPTDDVAVADPMWAQHPGVAPLLVVRPDAVAAVAGALDLPTAQERVAGVVTSRGEAVPTPQVVRDVVAGVPATWVEHEDLRVDGIPVDWWVEDDGGRPVVHAATTAGLARGLARVVDPRLGAHVERLLLDPASRAQVLLDLAGAGDA